MSICYRNPKNRAREDIEQWVLRRFQMHKLTPDGWRYELTIPYDSEEELDRIIYQEILQQAEHYADMRHCFIEADLHSLDDPERYW